MKLFSKYFRRITISKLKSAFFIFIIAYLFLPCYVKITNTEDTVFDVILNGQFVGTVSDINKVDSFMISARKKLAKESDTMIFTDSELEIQGEKRYFSKIDGKKAIINNMYEVLCNNVKSTRERAYTVKINELIVNLSTSEEVESLLEAALSQYDTENKYTVGLSLDCVRQLNVLIPQIQTIEEKNEKAKESDMVYQAGVALVLDGMAKEIELSDDKDFSDYELGLVNISYGDEVEVVESYLPKEQIISLQEATAQAVECQEKDAVYEVVDGDTLSEIAMKINLPMDKIIELNENLEDENSTIRVGDELVITMPEPALSVEYQEEAYYEEDYDSEIEYIYNDSWYTTESVVRQQPSAGHRKVVALVSHRNDKVTGTEILKEEVTMTAVAKIVEIGTKVPPTYIKPLSGGRFTSGFKKRWGRWHKGIDWATPVGTAVMASNGGTVARAGWASGYGYVVYINHTDGRQTRYGHLSKVLVKVGQNVRQGEKIALSGNTGRSTGPHVHFEILINGSQVNPLQYMN